MRLLSDFSPHVVKLGANADPRIFRFARFSSGELRTLPADLFPMGAFLKPNRPMANYVSRELARGSCQTPHYTPYKVADMSASPWPVPAADHTAALAKWKVGKKASKPGDRPMPCRDWISYRSRSMVAADLCADWAPFGGWAAHLNNLSVIPHCATAESVAAAIAYDSLLSARLGGLARARANRTAGAVDFMDLLSSEQQRVRIQAVAHAPESPRPPAPDVTKSPTKAPPVDPKAPNKRAWIPNQLYFPQLAAEEKASDAAAAAGPASAAATARAPSPDRSRRRSRARPLAARKLVVPHRVIRGSLLGVLNAVVSRFPPFLLSAPKATAPR